MSAPINPTHRDELPHECNPTGRFTDRADDYKQHRPSYPADAIDAMLAGLGTADTLTAADIGAGTGISSVLLAERGVRVLAVEPNAAMRGAGEQHTAITWIDGVAEATTIAASAVHLVLCAQAFHWFRPADALAEFARIVRLGGRVCLMWNDRDESDPFTAAYGQAIQRAADKDPGFFDHTRAEVFVASRLFRAHRELVFAYAQNLTHGGLLGRAMSASYIPTSGPAHDRLIRDLDGAHVSFANAHGGVQLRYRTRVFLADARAVS